MKKLLAIGLVFLTLSCNGKLWDEIEDLKAVNQAQANRLRVLAEENETLQIIIDDTEAELLQLIENNTDAIVLNTDEIVNSQDELLNVLGTIDSLSLSIYLNRDNIESLEEELLLNQQVTDSLIVNLEDELEDLADEVKAIEPVVNVTNVTVVNIQETYDDTEIKSDIEELFCDTEETEANYVLPAFKQESGWIGIYEDSSKAVLIDSIKRVQFGEYPNWTFRHYDENGWIGVFGSNYNEMELPEYDYSTTYQELLPGQDYVYTDEAGHPELGDIVELGEDAEGDLRFEFDPVTGEYSACADETATWFVNGVEVDEGANVKFNVGKLKGDYIITAKFGDGAAQHVVTKSDSGKGKMTGKIKKKVII